MVKPCWRCTGFECTLLWFTLMCFPPWKDRALPGHVAYVGDIRLREKIYACNGCFQSVPRPPFSCLDATISAHRFRENGVSRSNGCWSSISVLVREEMQQGNRTISNPSPNRTLYNSKRSRALAPSSALARLPRSLV